MVELRPKFYLNFIIKSFFFYQTAMTVLTLTVTSGPIMNTFFFNLIFFQVCNYIQKRLPRVRRCTGCHHNEIKRCGENRKFIFKHKWGTNMGCQRLCCATTGMYFIQKRRPSTIRLNQLHAACVRAQYILNGERHMRLWNAKTV